MEALMPRLARFGNADIAMFFADHNPPHFHVLGAEGAAQIAIESLEVIEMSGRVDLREALAWASAHRDFLREKWRELSE